MANPPITIGPFTNVPAPGSPIASNWPQDLTTAYVAYTTRATEWKRQGFSATSAAFPLAGLAIQNIPFPSRTFPRMIVANVQALLTRIAGDAGVDMTLTCVGASPSDNPRRIRDTSFATSITVSGVFAIPANVSPTLQVRLAAVASSITLSTVGGSDLNGVEGYAVPVNSFTMMV